MRLVTFLLSGEAAHRRKLGALIDNDRFVVDLAEAHRLRHGQDIPYFQTMLALIDGGAGLLEVARKLAQNPPEETCHERGDVTLLAPVPTPRRMRDFMSFEGHIRHTREAHYRGIAARADDPEAAFAHFREQGLLDPPRVWHEQPIHYKCNPLSVIAPDADIPWPRAALSMDYEIEIGIFIAARAKHIPPSRARNFIFGYTILNDVSAQLPPRGSKRGHPDRAKGQSDEVGHVIGPCLVTADEVPNPHNLSMIVRINGEETARGNSGDMYHKFEDMISHVSREDWVNPGEFLGSGTMGGGSGMERGRLLVPGDVVEFEVENLGILRNRIVLPDEPGLGIYGNRDMPSARPSLRPHL